MDPLFNLLKQLQSITPDAAFQKRSLSSILKPQSAESVFARAFTYFSQPKILAATGGTMALLIIGTITLISSLSSSAMASLNTDHLNKELQSLDLQLKISEMQYYENSLKTVSVALNETSKNGPGHLNDEVIEKELENIKTLETENKNLEELLNELTL